MHQRFLRIVLLLVFVSGCESVLKPASVDTMNKPYQDHVRIRYLSPSLSRRVEIVKHKADRTEGGLLRIQTVIRNHKDRDIVIEIKVTFTDADGFEREATNWEPIILGRRDITTYTRASLGSQVSDYRIAIR